MIEEESSGDEEDLDGVGCTGDEDDGDEQGDSGDRSATSTSSSDISDNE